MSESAQELSRRALALLQQWFDHDEAQRSSMLAELALSDPPLHARLQALLAADAAAQSQSFLSGGAASALTSLTGERQPLGDLAGQLFGHWRLLRPLGAGGMGQVWLAERSDNLYRGQAAIKLLGRASHDSAHRARFVREGELLGRLSHPNIARLLDAGISSSGERFLVLEFVDGERIDRWCDARQLDINSRIALFRSVCAAVAHAHANLIVHRDLKPANVMVTAAGEVKLLDFGIAKLLEPQDAAAAQSELTQLAGTALTPDYAAPEQVSGGAITTRTDVYSLGVILYSLLTGEHPYGNTGATPAERVKAVMETEPRRASATASGGAAEAAAAAMARASARATTPAKLRAALAGDLDNIVDRALRKAPAERYASADDLSRDLARFLAHEPVSARPDRLGYRARKFLRRHRLAATAGALALSGIVAGLGVALWQADAARRQEQIARTEAAKATAVKDFVLGLFRAGDVNSEGGAAGRDATVAQLLEVGATRIETDLTSQPEVRDELLDTLGILHLQTQSPERAERLYRALHAGRVKRYGAADERSIDAWISVGTAIRNELKYAEAEKYFREAIRQLDASGQLAPAVRGRALQEIAYVRYRLTSNKDAEAMRCAAEAIRLLEPLPHTELLTNAYYGLGRAQESAIMLGEAVQSYARGIVVAREVLGERSTAVAGGRQMRARALEGLGQFHEAESELREATALFLERAGPEHRYYMDASAEYAEVLERIGRWQEAEPMLRRALDFQLKLRGTDHSTVLRSRLTLARLLARSGDVSGALQQYDTILAQPALEKARPRARYNALMGAAHMHLQLGQFAKAGLAHNAAVALAQVFADKEVAVLADNALLHAELALARADTTPQPVLAALLEQADAQLQTALTLLGAEPAKPDGLRAMRWKLQLLQARAASLRNEDDRARQSYAQLRDAIGAHPERAAYADLQAQVLLALGRYEIAGADVAGATNSARCRNLQQAAEKLDSLQRPGGRERQTASKLLAQCRAS